MTYAHAIAAQSHPPGELLLPLTLLTGLLFLFLFGWLALRVLRMLRGETLDDFIRQKALSPIEPDDPGLSAPGLLAPFELTRNARWMVSRCAAGPVEEQAVSELRVIDMRGDPFGLDKHGELAVTVLALHAPGLDLPKFIITPPNIVTRSLSSRSAEVRFNDPFSALQNLVGPDRETLTSLFTLEVRQAVRDNRRFTIEANGPWILIYRFPTRMNGATAREAIALGDRLAGALRRRMLGKPVPPG